MKFKFNHMEEIEKSENGLEEKVKQMETEMKELRLFVKNMEESKWKGEEVKQNLDVGISRVPFYLPSPFRDSSVYYVVQLYHIQGVH